jgi:hypothetical protein
VAFLAGSCRPGGRVQRPRGRTRLLIMSLVLSIALIVLVNVAIRLF